MTWQKHAERKLEMLNNSEEARKIINKVAYCGVEGAFAHIAAGKIFPESNRIPFWNFKGAYESVVNGECDAAVLPIENSYVGEVGPTIDLIFFGDLFVNGIYDLEIRQNILGLPEAEIEDIKKVISHPQALAQCNEYLSLKGFETEDVSNTAVAAKMVAEAKDKSLGAIASVETAALYGLKILAESVNASKENTTRFAVLSKVQASSPEMTSSVLMFSVKHEVGSLATAINIIGKYGYNMTSLRSRPMKNQSWKYYFYVEIDGTVDSEQGEKMIEELNKVCDSFKVAGTFAPHDEI